MVRYIVKLDFENVGEIAGAIVLFKKLLAASDLLSHTAFLNRGFPHVRRAEGGRWRAPTSEPRVPNCGRNGGVRGIKPVREHRRDVLRRATTLLVRRKHVRRRQGRRRPRVGRRRL